MLDASSMIDITILKKSKHDDKKFKGMSNATMALRSIAFTASIYVFNFTVFKEYDNSKLSISFVSIHDGFREHLKWKFTGMSYYWSADTASY